MIATAFSEEGWAPMVRQSSNGLAVVEVIVVVAANAEGHEGPAAGTPGGKAPGPGGAGRRPGSVGWGASDGPPGGKLPGLGGIGWVVAM